MKKMKRLASILLAVIMTLAMAVPTLAATINLPTDDILKNHTFAAYQVFTGTQEETPDNAPLGDITWGDGINAINFVNALKADSLVGSLFSGITADEDGNYSAKDVAAAMDVEKVAEIPGAAEMIAKIAYANKNGSGISLSSGTTEVDAGYYLIVDTTPSVTGAEGEADGVYNAALLQVTSSITVGVKTDIPEAEKKVKENNSYTENAGYGNGYNDVADYDIGDVIPFAFYSEVPDMTYYDTYYFAFHDTMEKGLTFDPNSVKVTIGEEIIPAKQGDKVNYEVVAKPSDGCTFEVVFKDLKAITGVATGQKIRIDFSGSLNKDAQIGLPGNVNTMQLEYSNNPNGDGRGKGKEDKVIVFTYAIQPQKVDGDTKPLEGATFVLYKMDGEKKLYYKYDDVKVTWVEDSKDATPYKSDADGKVGPFKGVDEGTYYLHETVTPPGYNTAEDVTLNIEADTKNGVWETEAADALPKVEETEAKWSVTLEDPGTVTGNIVNQKGSTLPETGGIGTTIFYVIGAVLVLGAGILLVTKKRMGKE